MFPCEKCSDNNWIIEYNKGFMVAICRNCSNEIKFELRKKEKILKVGNLCRHCKTPVIYKESKFNKKKLKKSYYYTGYFYCPNCKAMYMAEEFKIYN